MERQTLYSGHMHIQPATYIRPQKFRQYAAKIVRSQHQKVYSWRRLTDTINSQIKQPCLVVLRPAFASTEVTCIGQYYKRQHVRTDRSKALLQLLWTHFQVGPNRTYFAEILFAPAIFSFMESHWVSPSAKCSILSHDLYAAFAATLWHRQLSA